MPSLRWHSYKTTTPWKRHVASMPRWRWKGHERRWSERRGKRRAWMPMWMRRWWGRRGLWGRIWRGSWWGIRGCCVVVEYGCGVSPSVERYHYCYCCFKIMSNMPLLRVPRAGEKATSRDKVPSRYVVVSEAVMTWLTFCGKRCLTQEKKQGFCVPCRGHDFIVGIDREILQFYDIMVHTYRKKHKNPSQRINLSKLKYIRPAFQYLGQIMPCARWSPVINKIFYQHLMMCKEISTETLLLKHEIIKKCKIIGYCTFDVTGYATWWDIIFTKKSPSHIVVAITNHYCTTPHSCCLYHCCFPLITVTLPPPPTIFPLLSALSLPSNCCRIPSSQCFQY